MQEVKVFGREVPVGEREKAWQRMSFGRTLMEEAEKIAKEEWKVFRIAVISGVDVCNSTANSDMSGWAII